MIKTGRVNDQSIDAKCSEISRRQNDRKQDIPNVSRDSDHALLTSSFAGVVVEADQRFQPSRFPLLTSTHPRYQSPEGEGGGRGPGSRAILVRAILPLRTFFSSYSAAPSRSCVTGSRSILWLTNIDPVDPVRPVIRNMIMVVRYIYFAVQTSQQRENSCFSSFACFCRTEGKRLNNNADQQNLFVNDYIRRLLNGST